MNDDGIKLGTLRIVHARVAVDAAIARAMRFVANEERGRLRGIIRYRCERKQGGEGKVRIAVAERRSRWEPAN